MKCEKCGKKHSGKFGSGRFCSKACSKSRIFSEDAIEKKRLAQTGKPSWNAGKLLVLRKPRICKNPECKRSFVVPNWKRTQFCSRVCAAWNNGGLRPNCGKHGSWYFCKELDRDVYLDSTWELELAKWLDSKNTIWTRGISYNWLDDNGVQHKYYPDFVIPLENRILDIKNRYLEVKDKEKIDKVMKQNNIIVEIINRKKLDEILRA